jgi:hypothetical protein
MKSMKFLFVFIGLGFIFYGVNHCSSDNKNPCNVAVKTERTLMKIYNGTNDTVLGYITLGTTDGCLQDILDVPFIKDTVQGQRGLQGWFTLNPKDSTPAYAPALLGYNGVISFEFAPNNCPDPVYPNGINQFEFILNNAYQGTNAQESVNISCVHGANCVIGVDAVSENPFNAGPTYTNVQGFSNRLDKNAIGLVGVYPYGCDTCTGSKTPPSCIPLPQPASKQSICQVQRNAALNGGLIKVVYLGKEEPLK